MGRRRTFFGDNKRNISRSRPENLIFTQFRGLHDRKRNQREIHYSLSVGISMAKKSGLACALIPRISQKTINKTTPSAKSAK